MAKPWFRPKRYGFGATPASWQGWLATFGFVAVMVAVVSLILRHSADPTAGRLVAAAAGIILLAAFAGFTWINTPGGFRWRWGQDD